MSFAGGMRAFGLGTAPALVVGLLLLLLGWTSPQPVPPPEGPPTAQNLAARAELLRSLLPPGFEVAVAAPFVVVAEGDAGAAARLVAAETQQLREQLFDHAPRHIIDVWLFASTASYRAGARTLLDDWPRTLSGYYAPRRRSVIVNLASGDGTLRHELVHPFMHENHPHLPAWVDEGVASLYEQVSSDAFEPRPCRHLARLQRIMEAGRLPSVAALSAGTDTDFYSDPRFLSYTQARYVMMFLAERQRLRTYLVALAAAGERDPTGLHTLLQVTGFPTEEELEMRWKAYVLSLVPPQP